MSQRYAQLALALMLPCLPLGMAMGASGNCNALGQLPAVIEVGEGLQTELQSPVAITR
ncbi:type II and III secretion system protein family protein, partial [Pseudomonas carnis]|nr:type II and III secretion system protein family protein [Pseudomonas carnis]